MLVSLPQRSGEHVAQWVLEDVSLLTNLQTFVLVNGNPKTCIAGLVRNP